MIPSVNIRKRRLLAYLESEEYLKENPTSASSFPSTYEHSPQTEELIAETEKLSVSTGEPDEADLLNQIRINQSMQIFDSILENITGKVNSTERLNRKRKSIYNDQTAHNPKLSKMFCTDSPSTSGQVSQQNINPNMVTANFPFTTANDLDKIIIGPNQTKISLPAYLKINWWQEPSTVARSLAGEVFNCNTASAHRLPEHRPEKGDYNPDPGKVNDIVYFQTSVMKKVPSTAIRSIIQKKCLEQRKQRMKNLDKENNPPGN